MKTIRGLSKLAAIFSVLTLQTLFAAHVTNLGPQLAGNASGVMAIWTYFNGSEYGIYQAQLPVGGSWSSPIQLTGTKQNCFYPAIAINSGGDILSAWQNASNAPADIQLAVNSFADMDAIIVTTPSFYASQHIPCSNPIPRLDNEGHGTAIWQGQTSSGYLMLGTECSISNLRAPIVTLSTPTTTNIFSDIVVKEDTGTAFVVWQQFYNSVQTIMAGSVTLDNVISGATPLSTLHAARPSLAVSSNDLVYATWWELNSSSTPVIKVTPLTDALATSITTLTLDNTQLMKSQLSVNASGNVLVVAEATLSDNTKAIATASKVNGTWSSVSLLSNDPTTTCQDPIVRLNNSNQGIALWQDTNGFIWTSLYSSGTWSTPTALSSSSYSCSCPALYLDPTGYAVAAWIAKSTADNITITIQSSTLSSFSGSWTAPSTISSP